MKKHFEKIAELPDMHEFTEWYSHLTDAFYIGDVHKAALFVHANTLSVFTQNFIERFQFSDPAKREILRADMGKLLEEVRIEHEMMFWELAFNADNADFADQNKMEELDYDLFPLIWQEIIKSLQHVMPGICAKLAMKITYIDDKPIDPRDLRPDGMPSVQGP